MQPKFRLGAALAGALLFAAVVAAGRTFESLPNREPAPPAAVELDLEPVALDAGPLAPLQLAGAWRVTGSDQRVGGLSALAVEGGELVAVTDAGAVLRFPAALRARLPASIADVPAGPGDERFKSNRDLEAIVRDPAGRGWWVAFENHDQLWLFDWGFGRALERHQLPRRLLTENAGIEGLAASRGAILAFPESGGAALRWSGGRWAEVRLDNTAPVSGAVELDDHLLLLVERRATLTGFRNVLALVRDEGAAMRTLWRKHLPVGRLDNVEAVAAAPTPGGGYRLWLISDDNFHPRMRTLLLVVDVPAAAVPQPARRRPPAAASSRARA